LAALTPIPGQQIADARDVFVPLEEIPEVFSDPCFLRPTKTKPHRTNGKNYCAAFKVAGLGQ